MSSIYRALKNAQAKSGAQVPDFDETCDTYQSRKRKGGMGGMLWLGAGLVIGGLAMVAVQPSLSLLLSRGETVAEASREYSLDGGVRTAEAGRADANAAEGLPPTIVAMDVRPAVEPAAPVSVEQGDSAPAVPVVTAAKAGWDQTVSAVPGREAVAELEPSGVVPAANVGMAAERAPTVEFGEPSVSTVTASGAARTVPRAGSIQSIFQHGVDDDAAAVATFIAQPDRPTAAAPRATSTTGTASRQEPQGRIEVTVSKLQEVDKLVMEFQAAVGRADYASADVLLQALESIRGGRDALALKLKAYLYMTRKEYVEAEAVLASVLEKDAYDLDAGVNMALVEYLTGRTGAARSRLARLEERYPGHSRLAQVKAQLK